ncbi:MAG: PhnD/SsuA/transferrin family substrate-binding protein [Rhodospirillales bacterium]|nr:PhnD/SsuA/transferrin family substrate-binding protein [Alphaproteobacteria bacterium]MBL6947391.1 PhnD/SsuA/transferrin family substrate-binding protein [Rhodospirillales bacterium]
MLGSARAEIGPPIRFGLTSVVVQENLRFLDRWAEHLSAKIGRPVEFVRRRSYREITDLLESGGLEFAWICGYPFIQKRDPEFLTLLAVPVYRGEPLYHSFIIVHRDSPHSKLEDLRGGVFSFSDPESNSGFLYPQSVLAAQGETPESFFRQTFFTFNHAETIEAVAEQVADGGAVDSYIWEYLRTYRPELTEKTRVIMRSPKFGFPPLVSRLGVDASIVSRMKTALAEMESDPEGQKFLDGLKLDRFGDFSPSLFDNIRRMADETRQSLPWLASKTKNKKY